MIVKLLVALAVAAFLSVAGATLIGKSGHCCGVQAACCELQSADTTDKSSELDPAQGLVTTPECCEQADVKVTKTGCCKSGCSQTTAGGPTVPVADVKAENTGITVVTVDGMTCGGCAATVSKAVGAVIGVVSAKADAKTGLVTVTAKKDASVSPKALWEAIGKSGYTPTKITGPAGSFTTKPAK